MYMVSSADFAFVDGEPLILGDGKQNGFQILLDFRG
jgi:hypothetical protein